MIKYCIQRFEEDLNRFRDMNTFNTIKEAREEFRRYIVEDYVCTYRIISVVLDRYKNEIPYEVLDYKKGKGKL